MRQCRTKGQGWSRCGARVGALGDLAEVVEATTNEVASLADRYIESGALSGPGEALRPTEAPGGWESLGSSRGRARVGYLIGKGAIPYRVRARPRRWTRGAARAGKVRRKGRWRHRADNSERNPGEVGVYYTIHNVMFSLHCAQPGPGFQGGAPTGKSRRDAEHIAAATVAGVGLLASRNFRHMVIFRRIQRYNDVNREAGYAPLDIRSPRELEYEE